MHTYEVLRRPIVSEKSIILQGVVRRMADLQAIGEIVTVSAQGMPVRNELRYGI